MNESVSPTNVNLVYAPKVITLRVATDAIESRTCLRQVVNGLVAQVLLAPNCNV